MSESRQLWMVDRTFDSRNLVTITYASTDGTQQLRKELSSSMLSRIAITAAITASEDELESVESTERRERFATEASRMAAAHSPDDEL
ncbi:hypothetical protein [Halocatena halophila]|uniref:hypothetical protein n=1 Tax=Halocatena halophila TaxID=2814576 RepID=UPI002ED25EA0